MNGDAHRRWIAALGLVLALLPGGSFAAGDFNCPAGQSAPAQFTTGFAALNDALGGAMGQPTECEHPDPNGSGDILQHTAGSVALAYWRKSINTPIWFNGATHYALTAEGLVSWTGAAVDPPADAVASDLAAPPPVPRPLAAPQPPAADPAPPVAAPAAPAALPLPAPAPSQPSPKSGVVLVAGAGSYWGNLPFAALAQALNGRGVSNNDIWYYSYQGFTLDKTGPFSTPYGSLDTCQDLGLSEDRLHAYLLAIRGGSNHSVSLVGHSLGGVVALETAIRYPDIQPMLRSVVTVDSPLMGISRFKEGQWLAWYALPSCSSMDQLVPRNQAKGTTLAYFQSGAQQLLNRGIWVTTIVNNYDHLFVAAHSDQGIDGVSVNVIGGWADSGTNHAAALNTPDGIQTILRAIP